MTTEPSLSYRANGRQRILGAARKLMLKQGFAGTTLDEICERACITKGSLFYHFKDKEALGIATVQYHLQLGQEMMATAPFLDEQDPLRKLFGYIDFIIAITTHPSKAGCLLGVMVQEPGANNSSVLQACAEAFSAWQDGITKMIEAAKLSYCPQARIDCSSLAQLFIATYEGAIIIAKARGDGTVINASLEHYKAYLSHLFINPTVAKENNFREPL